MPEIVERKAVSITAIKDRAGQVIRSHLPAWKQNNLIARQAALNAIQAGTYVGSDGSTPPARAWTPDEVSELTNIRLLWDWVESVRAQSDAYEAELVGGTIPNIAPRSAWPEFPAMGSV